VPSAPTTDGRAGAFKPRRVVGGCEFVEGGGRVRSVEEELAAAEVGGSGKSVEVKEEAEDRRDEGEGEGEGERERGGRLLTVGGALEVVEGVGGTPMSGGSFIVGWAY